jgi:SpoVK/Ycf46/Vps4 family AAA+-type ATPase
MGNTSVLKNWEELNQEYLTAELDIIRQKLEYYIEQGEKKDSPLLDTVDSENFNDSIRHKFGDSTLERLCSIFNLSPFERDIILLCAGVELDSRFAALCAKAADDPHKPYCTFNLALSILDKPHWSALNPNSALRRWKLIEIQSGQSLTSSSLRIDERILHYLTGISYVDERLQGIIFNVKNNEELPESYNASAQKINSIWKRNNNSVIQLTGNDSLILRTITSTASNLINANLYILNASDIPVNAADRIMLSRLWEREASLGKNILLIECDQAENSDKAKALKVFLEDTQAVILISGTEEIKNCSRKIISLNLKRMSVEEQYSLWQKALGPMSEKLNGQIEKAAVHFNLNASDIYSAAESVIEENQFSTDAELKKKFWNICRLQASRNLESLAQKIESSVSWDDIVLPESQIKILKEIAVHLKQSYKVYDTWGFKNKSSRGMGITALFSGSSGTGKTLAAEILANELQLDLYRIDLSSVVSKYIGETEKNLKKVFDTAEESGAILLFDEADALFGKRSEVKDSHDRYANIEVSYLLQRMELYRGLAILTTNLKSSLDTAFLRRIRFVLQFPLPDFKQRTEIWQNIFPKKVPLEKLDINKLAKLNLTGGNIQNIALNAAFIAADKNENVSMKHLLHASKNEYVKLEKTLTDMEIQGWV